MMETRSIEQIVREILVEVLAVEESEVIPTARFFADLDGESIDVLETGFRLEKALGVRVDFNAMFTGSEVQPNERGELSAESLARMQERFPFLAIESLPPAPTQETLKELLTVDAIVNLVRDALARQTPELAALPGSRGPDTAGASPS